MQYELLKKFQKLSKKKLAVEKFRFQPDLTISKFLTFLIFEARFCLQMALKNFYALFNHDVGMKSNLQVQGYLTHVESCSYDALNASQRRKCVEQVKLHSFVASLTRVYPTCAKNLILGFELFYFAKHLKHLLELFQLAKNSNHVFELFQLSKKWNS